MGAPRDDLTAETAATDGAETLRKRLPVGFRFLLLVYDDVGFGMAISNDDDRSVDETIANYQKTRGTLPIDRHH